MSFFGFTKLVVSSALHKPATRLYPAEKRPPYAATRGHIKFVADTCFYCSVCAKKCPTGAIVVNRKLKKWQIDPRKCILCSACVEKCPKACLTMESGPMAPMTDAEWQALEHDTGTDSASVAVVSNTAPAPTSTERAAAATDIERPPRKDG